VGDNNLITYQIKEAVSSTIWRLPHFACIANVAANRLRKSANLRGRGVAGEAPIPAAPRQDTFQFAGMVGDKIVNITGILHPGSFVGCDDKLSHHFQATVLAVSPVFIACTDDGRKLSVVGTRLQPLYNDSEAC